MGWCGWLWVDFQSVGCRFESCRGRPLPPAHLRLTGRGARSSLSTGRRRPGLAGMAEGFIRQRGNAWQVIVPQAATRSPASAATSPARPGPSAKPSPPCPTAHPGRRGQTTSHRRDPRSVAQALAGDGRPRLEHPGYLQGLHRADHPPTLGHLPLRRLDTATLDRFSSELRGRGGVGGRPMAPATVRQVHAILRRALDQAARWGWIPANPAALASPPRLGSAEIRPPRGGLPAP
jgi:hypothetical protein